MNRKILVALGPRYVNGFPNEGRMQRVMARAEANARMNIEDALKLNLRNALGAWFRRHPLPAPNGVST